MAFQGWGSPKSIELPLWAMNEGNPNCSVSAFLIVSLSLLFKVNVCACAAKKATWPCHLHCGCLTME